MKRVAVFGNTGGGKSTLAKRLAQLTGLRLYPLDLIQFRAGGVPILHEDYLKEHAEILRRETWIIDGFGCLASAWERFSAADTLVYVDLPLIVHYWWVTKRHVKGLCMAPEGWPENSPLWRSTINCYRIVGRCHRRLTPKYRQLVAETAASKQVHHLRSPAQMRFFLEAVKADNDTLSVGGPVLPVALISRSSRHHT
jgi:adenylate kinase family enzyme